MQQFELASKLESDLLETVDWGQEGSVTFSVGRTGLVSFDRSINTGTIDVKMNGSLFNERCCDCYSVQNWIGVFMLSLLLNCL